MKHNPACALLSIHLSELKTTHQPEYKFHPTRRWRFDFAIPQHKIAIEVEGGTWTGGRHVTGQGFERDCEKYNEATRLGWRVLRFTTNMVMDGRAKEVIKGVLRDLR